MKSSKSRTKKGSSLVVVILFASVLAIISVGTLSVAMSLYASGDGSAQVYSDIQSYRAATELACYQYVNDLEAFTVTKNLSVDWISVTKDAVYSEAIKLITDEVSTAEGSLLWEVTDITPAVAGVGVSNSSLLVKLLALFNGVWTKFQLYLDEYPALNYTSDEGEFAIGESSVPLHPFCVHVDLAVKGETLREELYVEGLFLNVITEKRLNATGGYDTYVTLTLKEGDNGIEIYRV